MEEANVNEEKKSSVVYITTLIIIVCVSIISIVYYFIHKDPASEYIKYSNIDDTSNEHSALVNSDKAYVVQSTSKEYTGDKDLDSVIDQYIKDMGYVYNGQDEVFHDSMLDAETYCIKCIDSDGISYNVYINMYKDGNAGVSAVPTDIGNGYYNSYTE